MEIRAPREEELEAVRAFLLEQGWTHRIGAIGWFRQLVAASRCVVAMEGGEVRGFARGVTDGLSNGYLSMVAVAPAHQRKGLGTALVRSVMGDSVEITWVLRAGRPGADAFFGRLGFQRSRDAMELRRKGGAPAPATGLAPRLNEGVYAYVSVSHGYDLRGLSPIATFREDEGLTLIVTEAQALAAGLPVLMRSAWITLTVDSDLHEVGLTAAVSRALADAGIACNVVAAAKHDHLFVPVEHAQRALAELEVLSST